MAAPPVLLQAVTLAMVLTAGEGYTVTTTLAAVPAQPLAVGVIT
jgi:hypothetical protein